jgi:hypothetical protein
LGARPTVSNWNILTYASLPYSGLNLLNPCPLQTVKDRWRCADTNLQVVKLTAKQKTFDLYRLASGLARGAESSNSLQKLLNLIHQLMHLYIQQYSSKMSYVGPPTHLTARDVTHLHQTLCCHITTFNIWQ